MGVHSRADKFSLFYQQKNDSCLCTGAKALSRADSTVPRTSQQRMNTKYEMNGTRLVCSKVENPEEFQHCLPYISLLYFPP